MLKTLFLLPIIFTFLACEELPQELSEDLKKDDNSLFQLESVASQTVDSPGRPIQFIDIGLGGKNGKDELEDGRRIEYSCLYKHALKKWKPCQNLLALSFNSRNGHFMWVPTFDQAGNFKFKIEGQVPGFQTEIFFSIKVKPIPGEFTLNTIANRQVVKETPIETIKFSSSTGDFDSNGTPLTYSCSYNSSPCSSLGMIFDSSKGTLAWTPANLGQYPLMISATNGSKTDVKGFTINVVNQNRPPVLDMIFNQNFKATTYLKLDFNDRGDDKDVDGNPLNYKCVLDRVIDNKFSGTLDCKELAGLNFDENTGVFIWLPARSNTGNYEFRITASDGSLSDSRIFTAIVQEAPNRAPQVDPIADRTLMVGEDFSFSVADGGDNKDVDGDPLWFGCFYDTVIDGKVIVHDKNKRKTCQSLGFIGLDTRSGKFLWRVKPQHIGKYEFVFHVSDGIRRNADQLYDQEFAVFTVKSKPVNNPPELDSISNRTIKYGNVLVIDVNDKGDDYDKDGTKLTYSCLVNNSSCPNFNPQTGVLNFNGNMVGTFNFKVSASDGVYSDEELFSITVKNSDSKNFELDELPSPIIVDKSKNDIINFSVSGSDKYEGKSIRYQCFYDTKIDGAVAENLANICPHFIGFVGNLMASIWFKENTNYEIKVIAQSEGHSSTKLYNAKLGSRVVVGNNHLSLIYPSSNTSVISIPKFQLDVKDGSKIKGIRIFSDRGAMCKYRSFRSGVSNKTQIDFRLFNCGLEYGTYQIKLQLMFTDGSLKFTNTVSYTVEDKDDVTIPAPISIDFPEKNSSTQERVIAGKVKIKKDGTGIVDFIRIYSDPQCKNLLSNTHLTQDGGNDPNYSDIKVTFPLLKSGTTSVYAKRFRAQAHAKGGTRQTYRRSPCSKKLAEVNFTGSEFPKFNGWKEIKGGANYECGMSMNQQIYCRSIGSDYSKTALMYGEADIVMLSELEFIPVIPPTGVKYWTKLFGHGINPCAIGDNGSTYCWGRTSSYSADRHAFYLPIKNVYPGASTAIHNKLFKLDVSSVSSSPVKELYRYDIRHCQSTNANMCLNESTSGCFTTLDDSLFCGGKKVTNPAGVNGWKTVVDGYDYKAGTSSYAKWCGLTQNNQMYCSKYYSGYVPKNAIKAPVLRVPNTPEKIQTLPYQFNPNITTPTMLKPISANSTDNLNLVEFEIHWEDEINFDRIDVFLDSSCSEPVVKKTFNPNRPEERTIKVPFKTKGINKLYARLSDKERVNGSDQLESSACVGPLATYNFTGESQGSLNGFKKLTMGYDFDCAIGSNDALYCRGLKKALPTNQIEYNFTKRSIDRFENFAPILVHYPTKGFRDIKINADVACALSLENQLYCNGNLKPDMKLIEKPAGVQYWTDYVLLSQNAIDPVLCGLANTGDVYCALNHGKANLVAAPNNERWVELKRAVLKVANGQSRIFLKSSGGTFYQADYVLNNVSVNAKPLATPVNYLYYVAPANQYK